MFSDRLHPRLPYGQPCHEDGGQNLPTSLDHTIILRHPGYSDDGNILMILSALDHPEGGLHHETARIACAIVANNRWEGFLTETRTGECAQTDSEGILRGSEYYFRISDDADEKYAVVPTFAHWRFPHNDLPHSWRSCNIPQQRMDAHIPRRSTLTAAILERDISCRITNHVEGTEHAHLVPRIEQHWFSNNQMFRYAVPRRFNLEAINEPKNAILLRSDVHKIFDQKRFAIIPKSSLLLVHIVAPGPLIELTKLYHNVSLQPIIGVAIQYILARFAWTIFAQSTGFLERGLERKLYIYNDTGITSIEEFSGDQCRQLLRSRVQSRSQSGQKRQWNGSTAGLEEEDDEEEEDIDYMQEQEDEENEEDIDDMQEEEDEESEEDYDDDEWIRGRKRRRSSITSLQDSSLHYGVLSTSRKALADTDIKGVNHKPGGKLSS